MKITVRSKDLLNALQEFNYKAFGTYGIPTTEQLIDITFTPEDLGMPQMCSFISFETNVDPKNSFKFRDAETAKCKLDVFSADEGYEPVITCIESSRVKIK